MSVVAGEADGDLHAGLDEAVVGRLVADLGAAQHVLELADAGLVLALLLAGGVVAAVLLEVALVAGGSDLGGDVGAHVSLEVLQLLLQAVVSLLRHPDGLGSVGCVMCLLLLRDGTPGTARGEATQSSSRSARLARPSGRR